MKYLKVILAMVFGVIGGYLLGWILVQFIAGLLVGTPNFYSSPRCDDVFICKNFELLWQFVPPVSALLGVPVALGFYWLFRDKISLP